jgi:hypothetical protein
LSELQRDISLEEALKWFVVKVDDSNVNTAVPRKLAVANCWDPIFFCATIFLFVFVLHVASYSHCIPDIMAQLPHFAS